MVNRIILLLSGFIGFFRMNDSTEARPNATDLQAIPALANEANSTPAATSSSEDQQIKSVMRRIPPGSKATSPETISQRVEDYSTRFREVIYKLEDQNRPYNFEDGAALGGMSKIQFEKYITSFKISKVRLDSWYGGECESGVFSPEADCCTVVEHLEVLGKYLEQLEALAKEGLEPTSPVTDVRARERSKEYDLLQENIGLVVKGLRRR